MDISDWQHATIDPMIEFLVEFPSNAPVDTALLLIMAIYAVVASRVLADSEKRDNSMAERMRYWQSALRADPRESVAKRGTSPAG